MTHVENAAIVVHQDHEVPNIRALEAAYGVEFVPASREQMDSFGRLCDKLEQERVSLNGLCTDLGVTATKQAVAYRPSVFLKRPLTSEQTIAINSGETAAVANYCIGVQSELAKVPIEESGERMVSLQRLFHDAKVEASYSTAPFHAACGEWAGMSRVFWAREGFANRALVMGKILETVGVQLHFEDAFRPVGVQEGLFKRRVAWTIRDHPDWTEEQVIAEAQSKTAVKPRLASHKGGAAIDARLRSSYNGELHDIGHNYPDGGALVFPRTPFLTVEQWRNRQLFQAAAGLADTTLYVGEDWHISYGDNLASLDEQGQVRPGYVAKYGPVKDFSRTTGEILEVYTATESDQVFDYQ